MSGDWAGSYFKWALTKDRTPDQYLELVERLKNNPKLLQALHGAIGISGESGELIDAIKKVAMYGKPMDFENIKEELGDLCWYMTLVMSAIGTNWAEVFQNNHDKLEKRYPSGFTEKAAQERADKA